MSTARRRLESLEKIYMRKIYRRVIMMAMLMHLCYVFLFWGMRIRWMAAYNVGSVSFYLLMTCLVDRGRSKAAVALVHGEVCLFVTLAVAATGWGLGFQILLLSTAALVYFCPFENKYIPYLFAITEMVLYMGLYVYVSAWEITPRVPLRKYDGWIVYLFNVGCSFGLILYAALISNLSSNAAKKQLLHENADLTALASHDALTGLWLRRPVEERLAGLWKRREQGVHFAVAMGDIDNFKQVNDTYGHACGDAVLRSVAELFSRNAGVDASICRWGGEEFLLFFRGCERREAAEIVGELCRLTECTDIACTMETIRVTITFGVSDSREADNLEEMVALADKRLYIGKNCGKNRVVDSGPETAGLEEVEREAPKASPPVEDA